MNANELWDLFDVGVGIGRRRWLGDSWRPGEVRTGEDEAVEERLWDDDDWELGDIWRDVGMRVETTGVVTEDESSSSSRGEEVVGGEDIVGCRMRV